MRRVLICHQRHDNGAPLPGRRGHRQRDDVIPCWAPARLVHVSPAWHGKRGSSPNVVHNSSSLRGDTTRRSVHLSFHSNNRRSLFQISSPISSSSSLLKKKTALTFFTSSLYYILFFCFVFLQLHGNNINT